MRLPFPTARFASAAFAVIASACSIVSPAVAEQSAAGYYGKKAEGWFWYQDPPVAEEKEPETPEQQKPEEAPVVVMKAPPAEKQPADQVKVDGPPALSAAWFRENLQVYIDKAIDDPSPENVEAYFLLQRVMMDKAQAFTDMSQRVVLGDPILDEINRRSMDPSSSRLQETLSGKRREEALSKVLQKAGLAFFYRSDCELCANQGQILKFLIERTGIEVMAISIDGKPLPNGAFADNLIVDQGQAAALGVDEGPALFMLAPPDSWVPLAYGAVTQEDVITRLLVIATEEGILSEEDFNRTKPINVTASLASALPEDGSLPEDPAELIQYLRSLEKK